LPDFSKFIDFSSLFVALGGLLFATWHPLFQDLLSQPRPPLYLNRRTYITALGSGIISKAVPLAVFLLAYVISLLGVVLRVASLTEFTLNPASIDPAATLFMLTYGLASFLAILTVWVLGRLVVAWWKAGSDRGTNPKLTVLR
jgi:hypothetical protein